MRKAVKVESNMKPMCFWPASDIEVISGCTMEVLSTVVTDSSPSKEIKSPSFEGDELFIRSVTGVRGTEFSVQSCERLFRLGMILGERRDEPDDDVLLGCCWSPLDQEG